MNTDWLGGDPYAERPGAREAVRRAERDDALAAAYRGGYDEALAEISAQLAAKGIELQVKRAPVATGA